MLNPAKVVVLYYSVLWSVNEAIGNAGIKGRCCCIIATNGAAGPI